VTRPALPVVLGRRAAAQIEEVARWWAAAFLTATPRPPAVDPGARVFFGRRLTLPAENEAFGLLRVWHGSPHQIEQRLQVKKKGLYDVAYGLKLEAHTYERVLQAFLQVTDGESPGQVPSRL
jgi:hypothetical protein